MPSKTTRSTELIGSSTLDFRGLPIQWLRTVFVQFLQNLFSYLPVGNYHWEDSLDTEIHIYDECPIKTEDIGARPAIGLVRAPMNMTSIGLDDMVSVDQQAGRKVKTTLLPGNMILNCCSRSSLESENLAMFAAENLWMLRDVLQKNGGFFDVGRNYAIGSPSPAGSIVQGDSADKYSVTTVTCPFHIIRISSVTEMGLKVMNSFAMSMNNASGAQPVTPVPPYEFPVASSAAVPSASITGQSVPANVSTLAAPGVRINPPSIRGRRI